MGPWLPRRPTLLLCVLLPAACLLQGCDALISGWVANGTAIQAQEHAAYTDYLFGMQSKNATLRQSGQPPQAIMSKADWLDEVYRPKLMYANYYVDHSKINSHVGPPVSYEAWRDTEYKKYLADNEARFKASRNVHSTSP